MDPKKMTGKVQEALQGALNLAQELSNCQFGATHLAVCLFEDNGGIARSASFKVVGEEGWRSIKRVLRRRLEKLPSQTPAPDEVPPGKDILKV